MQVTRDIVLLIHKTGFGIQLFLYLKILEKSFVESHFLPKKGFNELQVKYVRIKNKRKLLLEFIGKILVYNLNFSYFFD